ncbi:MAG: hypothetical protein KatS3mg046_623 [Bellilinea sp.]|nr:MAG: hypothetical protein KatS3mg046_623 [Bellilinea sp.]
MCVLVCSRERVGDAATHLLVELALRGEALAIDGGNRLQAYPLARALRERTNRFDFFCQRVLIRRAFTAYQLLALLESLPLLTSPLVILDPLASFYDETLPVGQARWLVQRCLQEIERLKRAAPVFLLLRTCPLPQRRFLQDMVCRQADTLFYEHEEITSFVQPALF